MVANTRTVAFIIAVMLAVGAANAVLTARSVGSLRNQQLTICNEQADLGNLATIKVQLNPKTHKASPVGIAIIADSRAAVRGLGCPVHLKKPGPSFVHWAHVFGLPAG